MTDVGCALHDPKKKTLPTAGGARRAMKGWSRFRGICMTRRSSATILHTTHTITRGLTMSTIHSTLVDLHEFGLGMNSFQRL